MSIIFLNFVGGKLNYDMFTVYTITQDGVVKYVGKTKDYTRRKRRHINYRGTPNSAIPTDIDLSNVEIQPITTFETNNEALKYEDEMIRKYDTINNGWNTYRSGHIYVENMNAYERARHQKPEYKAWKKEYMKAYEQTPERKARMKAREQTPEYKAWRKEYQRQYRLRKKQ